jgi:hypothetical protein
MSQPGKNTVVLAILCLIVAGVGGYLVFWSHANTLQRLEDEEKVLRLKEAKLSELFEEQAQSKEAAEAIRARWRTRYKTIPETLRTSDVVRYVNEGTNVGFREIHVNHVTRTLRHGYEVQSFQVEGQGYFVHLYDLIWKLEQQRQLFKVRNLEILHETEIAENPRTGREEMYVVVDFSFILDAYFGGLKGISADRTHYDIPASIRPPRQPAVNPFYPSIMDKLPPNSEGLINIEVAELISVVGREAVFQAEDGLRRLKENDRVYLGRVQEIDPEEGMVLARLNKGGIIERVERQLNANNRHEQAQGSTELSPVSP